MVKFLTINKRKKYIYMSFLFKCITTYLYFNNYLSLFKNF